MPALQSNAALDAQIDDKGNGPIALKPEYRRAIEAAIPESLSTLPRFWEELTSTVAAFSISQQIRASRPPSVEIERWKGVEKLEDKLGAAYEAAGQSSLEVEFVVVGVKDGERGLRCNESGIAIGQRHRRATRMIAAYETSAEGFEGNRNMHRDALFRWVLALWHQGLGQDIGTTRDKATGTATEGPLFRFFTACTEPLIDKPLSPSGLSKVVNRLL